MKIRSMLAAACACLITSGSILSFTTALPAQAAFGLGDFDGNDSIDVDDAVSVLTFYAKAAAGVAVDDLSDEQFNAADIDTDGSISVQDAVYILTYYAQTSAGLEPSWEDILPEIYGIPAWQTAYYDLLLSGAIPDSYGDTTYSLIYIDQDDNPELLVNAYSGGKLYTYKEDTGCSLVHSWTSGRSNGFCGYAEGTGYFYTFGSSGALSSSMRKQELVGNSFVLRDSISMDNGTYQHNGVSCTKSQYNSIQKSYTDSCTDYYKYSFLEFMSAVSDERTPDFNQLKTALESYRPVYAMEVADYNGDGKEEAFVVLGEKNSSSKTVQGIYYISSDGYISEARTDFSVDMFSNANYVEYDGKGFFACDVSGGGSGWVTYLYDVRDGWWNELNLSGSLQSFFKKDDICYTTKSVFSAQYGHQYVDVPLNYDKDTQEFSYPES
ncbi:MAG: hypothetical protein MR378_03370 [Ruminococcus sp.]|nr:hypothetical protein [Ruminococcus sp.]